MIPGVRRALVAKQRAIGERSSVVMEGRDIGTVVFPRRPGQDLPGCRSRRARAPAARRRCGPRERRSPKPELAAQIEERDQRDSTRAEAPLAQAPDAVYLDSTALGIEDVEEAISEDRAGAA